MTHTHTSTTAAAEPPNLEWSGALALCRQYGIGGCTLRKWQENNTEGLCFHPPGRRRRRLYRRSVLLRLCGVE